MSWNTSFLSRQNSRMTFSGAWSTRCGRTGRWCSLLSRNRAHSQANPLQPHNKRNAARRDLYGRRCVISWESSWEFMVLLQSSRQRWRYGMLRRPCLVSLHRDRGLELSTQETHQEPPELDWVAGMAEHLMLRQQWNDWTEPSEVTELGGSGNQLWQFNCQGTVGGPGVHKTSYLSSETNLHYSHGSTILSGAEC